jgi:hypothetical protein
MMTADTPTPDHDYEKTYRAIGHFIFAFSLVEFVIRAKLAEEIGLDKKHFAAVVRSYDVALLCRVAIEVFTKSRPEANAARIKVLIDEFLKFNDTRNRVAHGLWRPDKEDGTVNYVSRNSLKAKRFPSQVEELEKQADGAYDLIDMLLDAFEDGRPTVEEHHGPGSRSGWENC